MDDSEFEGAEFRDRARSWMMEGMGLEPELGGIPGGGTI